MRQIQILLQITIITEKKKHKAGVVKAVLRAEPCKTLQAETRKAEFLKELRVWACISFTSLDPYVFLRPQIRIFLQVWPRNSFCPKFLQV